MHIFDTHLIITHNGFHKGGRAAEGGPPTFVEAGGLRPPAPFVGFFMEA